jgi:hypothetical protein
MRKIEDEETLSNQWYQKQQKGQETESSDPLLTHSHVNLLIYSKQSSFCGI